MKHTNLRNRTDRFIRAKLAFALVIVAAAIPGVRQAHAKLVTLEFAPATFAAVENLITTKRGRRAFIKTRRLREKGLPVNASWSSK